MRLFLDGCHNLQFRTRSSAWPRHVIHKVLDIHVHHIHIGRMTKLSEHMQMTGETDAALAGKVKCDRSMVTKIRHGKVTPSLPLALAISRETGVEIQDLMPSEAVA